jgi:hypothetical protein
MNDPRIDAHNALNAAINRIVTQTPSLQAICVTCLWDAEPGDTEPPPFMITQPGPKPGADIKLRMVMTMCRMQLYLLQGATDGVNRLLAAASELARTVIHAQPGSVEGAAAAGASALKLVGEGQDPAAR